MKPALTADEWKQRWPSSTEYVNDCQECAVGQGVGLHGAAALCLYGRPFGFTREDLPNLRMAALYFGPGTGAGVALSSVADRIEALLPREEKS